MNQISVSDLRQKLPSYLNRVFAGEEFFISKNNIPIAHLNPIKQKRIVLRKRKILSKAFGMWKDRWPPSKSSEDIVDEWRKGILYGKHSR